ncbi:DNA glycosylase AlkZ-like family protein [Timonella sp. A28]|uniref:DNA glycosylase AlkZ-like family protein n=1 Tax=Timonella sp. A28 TaxID=3442640 RepID=UPI003EB6E839
MSAQESTLRSEADPLTLFSQPTQTWFRGAFDTPTSAQVGAWNAVSQNNHAVVVAPTGSGKTLAAFLWAIDQISRTPVTSDDPAQRCKILYISPLKALAADVERNLRSPLRGIEQAALRLGHTPREILVGTRTGDTPQSERRKFAKTPPDILITTPESLFLMLTSGARAGLAGIETVIIDEIHYVAGTKRGAHLAVSLERLDDFLQQPARRIGLSATVEPVSAVAEYLSGGRPLSDGGRIVTVVKPHIDKTFDISVTVPIKDMTVLNEMPSQDREGTISAASTVQPPTNSMWPHVEEEVVDLVAEHTSTLIFTNGRRGAERLTSRMNEIWAQRQGEDVPPPGERHAAHIQAQSGASAGVPVSLARAHHGSMSRAERTRTESDLKSGLLPAVVSTSSLELGIDMGAIDLVVQVGPPPSVASGLQRVGRAGHQVGAVSHGRILPLHRGELPATAVIAQRMREGQIEPFHRVHNPLDVLAQHLVAMVAAEDISYEDALALVRRSAPFSSLGEATFRAVLDMLSGRYPSEDFGELRARIVWDRTTNILSARPGALRLATTSGGTIPDRGLYGVFLIDDAQPASFAYEDGSDTSTVDPRVTTSGKKITHKGGKRVGELDEEMVYESRVGDVFTLGSSTWRIEEITPDRVLVSPAPGVPGRLPFWKGDGLGRPVELGRAIGQWLRTTTHSRDSDPAWQGLDAYAQRNLAAYLDEQTAATGSLPHDKNIVIEKFRDELGDWRVVIHSPFGSRVHAPWALVISDRVRTKFGVDASAMHSDDGIVLRIPNTEDAATFDDPFAVLPAAEPAQSLTVEDILIDPEDVARVVREQVSDSSLFGARFREAAARALLLPKTRPDKRQPLWQQRQRSAQLLSVASSFPDFPIVLEAVRECLQDDFDVPALTDIMRTISAGAIRVSEVTTQHPSPFAQTLLFGYTAQFLYDADAPLAERRAAALTLDPTLLAELLGQEGVGSLADILDVDATAETIRELLFLTESKKIKTAEQLWEFLLKWGPATLHDISDRVHAPRHDDLSDTERSPTQHAHVLLQQLEQARRIIRVKLAGVSDESAWQWAAIEDASRLRDALGVALPAGIPADFIEPVADPLGDLIRRYARTHGPFTAAHVGARFGLGIAVVRDALRTLEAQGLMLSGKLLPQALGGTHEDYCDVDVMRLLRRRSLAALRADVEPVSQSTLGVFLPQWQHVGELHGINGLYQAIEQLTGVPVPLSALESHILPARVKDYTPSMLDELTTSGEVVWIGHKLLPGPRGGKDAMISLHLADGAELTLPSVTALHDHDELSNSLDHTALFDLLQGSGGFFASHLIDNSGFAAAAVERALWDLVWAGLITNDTISPLRSLVGRVGSAPASRANIRSKTARSRFGGLSPVTPRNSVPASIATGRWTVLPQRVLDPTRRIHACITVLLERYGLVTRSINTFEDLEHPFSALYQVLSTAESLGKIRRGYFVEKLGGSQFAADGAVDVLRTTEADLKAERSRNKHKVCVLAAMDPANPYGAFVNWPETLPSSTTHRPGRKAGASVVLVDGDLVLYVERGGKTVLSFTHDSTQLLAAANAVVAEVDSGRLPKIQLSKINDSPVLEFVRSAEQHPVFEALRAVGFSVTPAGLRYQPHPSQRYGKNNA